MDFQLTPDNERGLTDLSWLQDYRATEVSYCSELGYDMAGKVLSLGYEEELCLVTSEEVYVNWSAVQCAKCSRRHYLPIFLYCLKGYWQTH